MSRITEYLDRKGFQYSRNGTEAQMNCPFCEDTERKFFINLESGLWQCFHANKCGRSGTFWQLQKDLGDEPMNINDRVQPLRKQYKKPSGTVRQPGNKILTWLSKRKITPETAKRFSIGQLDEDTIVFPYYFDGQLVNRKHRKLFNLKEGEDSYRQEKGAKPCLFGRDLISPDADTLLVVEGECDALAAWQYGLEAVSIPGGANNSKWIEEEWEYLQRFRRILLALDNDTAGEDGVEAIVKRLGYKWDVYRVRLPFKDVNDCLINGVLEDEVRWCLEKAESLRPPEVKRLSEVVEHLRDEPEAGLPCELPGLTEKLGGWRPGELTIHGGEAACGKTTATCQEAVGLLEQGQRVCMASLEMPVRILVYIMAKQTGELPAQFAYKYGEQLVFIDVPGSLEVERLVDLMSYAVERYGVEHLVVDSLGCLVIDRKDYWLLQKEAVGRLVRFARDHGVTVQLVHHLRKPGKDEKAGRVNHADLEGSAWIRNLADNVLLYRRIRDGDKKSGKFEGVDALVFVDKNRFRGEEGVLFLSYDHQTRRFGIPGLREEKTA